MRLALLPALLAAAPAPLLASASVDCETTDGSNIALIVNMDRDGAHGRINDVTLTIGARTMRASASPPQLVVGRRLFNDREIRLELRAPGSRPPMAALRLRLAPDAPATGTLRVDGQDHPVTCEFG